MLLALGAGASYALYTIAGRELLRRQPPDAVTAVAFFGGALLLAPLLFAVDLTWLAQPRGLLVALHLGLVTTALSYILYIRALITVPTATAVTLALTEPLEAIDWTDADELAALPPPAIAPAGVERHH